MPLQMLQTNRQREGGNNGARGPHAIVKEYITFHRVGRRSIASAHAKNACVYFPAVSRPVYQQAVRAEVVCRIIVVF